ncbi:unnamed protein product [Adineta steineri]|uniref:F-box domain-containing protein n=1 Tax=Adineta steineri TaxID=433720 RepID=A0A815PWC8_9BILA|nr:unnamed protein product [Adineta steineri]CAF1455129.1 unnamed protein product [Adineta steineri]CAF1568808.1 unnamed protein product [Adineta steineri]
MVNNMKLEDMSNELFLCIWDQLLMVDVIYSFSNLNRRIDDMLFEFCGLYKELDLRYCSLSIFRYFSHQIVMKHEWRLNLTVLKIGTRYRCSQMTLLADEVIKFFVKNSFIEQNKQYNNSSRTLFHMITSLKKKNTKSIFPQLNTLIVSQNTTMNGNCRDIFLYAIAYGSNLRTLKWITCSFQTHHSKSFFDWLFQCSINLNKFQFENPTSENGDYIEAKDDLDEHLPKTINHSIELHTLKFRILKIKGRGCYKIENLILRFVQSLENLSISMYHRCDNEPHLNYNGYYLSILCEKLKHLRSLHFAIQIQLFEKADRNIINHFTKTFSTPFWLNGPFGYKRVCVDFEQTYGLIQMFSLPYTFNDITLIHSIDLINIQFNTDLEENKRSQSLTQELETLWSGMDRLFLRFDKNQILSSLFIQALQCPSTQNKTLVFSQKRGIISQNIANQIQLTHFNVLELGGSIDTNINYNLEDRFPQLKCLRLMSCKNISSSWQNIDQWISFILTHINEHQLTCVRFDFIENENKITEMNICNQMIRILQSSWIIDIHQIVQDNHIALWIDRRKKYFSSIK